MEIDRIKPIGLVEELLPIVALRRMGFQGRPFGIGILAYINNCGSGQWVGIFIAASGVD